MDWSQGGSWEQAYSIPALCVGNNLCLMSLTNTGQNPDSIEISLMWSLFKSRGDLGLRQGALIRAGQGAAWVGPPRRGQGAETRNRLPANWACFRGTQLLRHTSKCIKALTTFPAGRSAPASLTHPETYRSCALFKKWGGSLEFPFEKQYSIGSTKNVLQF